MISTAPDGLVRQIFAQSNTFTKEHTLVDLGGDLKRLEKRGLSGLEAGGASRHNNGALCNAADASRSFLAVGENDGPNLAKRINKSTTSVDMAGGTHHEDPRW